MEYNKEQVTKKKQKAIIFTHKILRCCCSVYKKSGGWGK